MARSEENPTLNQFGDEVHPAFGLVTVSRAMGTARTLFQSDLQHNDTVILRISTASRKRDLKHDWLHHKEEIVEIEMSEAQWASVISSVGLGSGVPVTIRQRGYELIPDLPYQPRTETSRQEVRDAANELLSGVTKAFKALEDAEERKAGVKERRELRRALASQLNGAAANQVFAVKSLEDAAERAVAQARADIELTAIRAAQAAGIDPSMLPTHVEALAIEDSADE